MIEYRSFLNTDIDALREIWGQQPSLRCMVDSLRRHDIEQLILSKPWFDSAGLILAIDRDRPLGFVHAGFGPRKDRGCVDKSTGVLSQLRVVDHSASEEIAQTLLERAIEYLRSSGSKVCVAGSAFPFAPFYLGLYGGSRIPGVPDEDTAMAEALIRFGFEPGGRIVVLERDLNGLRIPTTRTQLTMGRQYQVQPITDPIPSTWWMCCAYGAADLVAFEMKSRKDDHQAGAAFFWQIQPLSDSWGKRTVGMIESRIEKQLRQQGRGGFLVAQAFRHLADRGYQQVEIQLRETDEPALALARRMGFELVSGGQQMQLQL